MATSIEPVVATRVAPNRSDRSLRQRLIDLPVGRKLSIGFGALTAVLALVIGCLFLTVHRLGAANSDIVRVASARSQAADHLRFASAELRAAQQAYVIDGGAGRSSFDQATARFETALGDLRSSGADRVEQALIRKIATGYQTFLSTDQLIWDALQRDDAALATNLTLGPESLAFGFMADDASMFSDRAEVERLEAIARFDSASSQARVLGAALGGVALLVMLVASWLITRLIRNPLHRVQQAAERAADGDLDATADVVGDDETGRLARAFNSMLAKLRLREETLHAEHHREEIAAKVHRAFEMADEESMALEVIGLTLSDILEDRSAELLLADNSKSNLEQAVVVGPTPDGPGCPVASPFSCVAVRSSSPVTFASSAALDACPHLRNRGVDNCSAVCVPVTFMGRAIGVLHTVGEEFAPPSPAQVDALCMLSAQAGARIGMLRTMVRTQVQASTDSMTGLMNRRTFQVRARSLRRADTPFAFVMADIDHFKRVNDTYGHEMGDRALKTFSDIAKASLRHSDVMARWGGEEFAFALPGLTAEQATATLDRIGLELAARLSTSDIPAFTVSYGVVNANECPSMEAAIRLADDALYEAKAQGRDRSIIADTTHISFALDEPRLVRMAEQSVAHHGVLAGLAADDDPLEY